MSRMIKELTHPQGEMLKMRSEYKVPFPLFVGGYGCGKSEILVSNAIRDISLFKGCKVACYAPTLDLLGLNVIPRIEAELDIMGISHKYNAQKKIMFLPGDRQFIFRSMDAPGRIVAYEVFASHIDEIDLMTTVKKANEVWNRIIARNRQKWMLNAETLHPRHFNMVSGYTTPEGYKFTYGRWKKEPGEGYKYVQAPTASNWNLDESFIRNLKDTYTPAQCKAYLDGNWTNIFTGSVYSYFHLGAMSTKRTIRKGDNLLIGCDFNYGGSCLSVYTPLLRKKDLKMVGLQMLMEHAVMDTEEMVKVLKSEYNKHDVYMFPDATGDSNSSNASESDISMLKQGGFNVQAHSTNPRIADRINSVQRLMYNGLFRINPDTCPKSVEALEEHAYNEITGLPQKIPGPATIDDRNDSAGYPCAFLFPIKKTITTRADL